MAVRSSRNEFRSCRESRTKFALFGIHFKIINFPMGTAVQSQLLRWPFEELVRSDVVLDLDHEMARFVYKRDDRDRDGSRPVLD